MRRHVYQRRLSSLYMLFSSSLECFRDIVRYTECYDVFHFVVFDRNTDILHGFRRFGDADIFRS